MEGPTWHLNVEPTQLQEENQIEPTDSEVIPLTQSTGIHKIINIYNYSSLTKLLNITGYVLRFLYSKHEESNHQTN